jgi:DNA-binding NarL/FixJ family response regulator
MQNSTKRVQNGGDDQAVSATISSVFQLDGAEYMLVEGHSATAPLPASGVSGAISVGHCEMNGKTYTVLRLDSTLDRAEELAAILTERELEITTLVALGWPNKQVADHLHISEWTVSAHLRRVFAKLRVHSRAAMVYRCTPLIGVWAKERAVAISRQKYVPLATLIASLWTSNSM